MEKDILSLLAGRNSKQAQDFVLAFSEHRAASWADSQRQAAIRAASQRHIPGFRGQLRHQLGETALASAAQVANVGCIPIMTVKPGGVFMVARIGRFGLVSLCIAGRKFTSRSSATRRLLSGPNDDLDPQRKLWLADKSSARGTTELAYFGCMVACPSRRDPSVPAEMVFAIPNARMTEWIEWIPLTRLFAMLQDVATQNEAPGNAIQSKPIPDRRIPKFRLPRQDEGTGNEGTSD